MALARITDRVSPEDVSAFDLTKRFKHNILLYYHFRQCIESKYDFKALTHEVWIFRLIRVYNSDI